MNDAETFKLDELAAEAGTSPRTVRYYVQRGLLPGPAFRGKDTAYTREHLVRLRAIRRLQERFLPLDAIQVELARLSHAELEKLADGKHVALLGPPLPAAPSPGAAPAPAPARAHGATRWVRQELVPGLELSVVDGAPDEVRTLVDEIRMLVDSEIRKRGAKK